MIIYGWFIDCSSIFKTQQRSFKDLFLDCNENKGNIGVGSWESSACKIIISQSSLIAAFVLLTVW